MYFVLGLLTAFNPLALGAPLDLDDAFVIGDVELKFHRASRPRDTRVALSRRPRIAPGLSIGSLPSCLWSRW